MSNRLWILAILFVLAISAAPAFAQDPIALAASDACLCTCKTANHGSGEQYYELDANGACNINGGACVHGGQRGVLSNCVKAPKPLDKASLAAVSTEEFLAYLNEKFPQ